MTHNVSDYDQVKKALASGVQPSDLCSTCPWDRHCITPPTMTAQDVKQQLDESVGKAKAEEDKDSGLVGALMTGLLVAGKDTQAQICPVFALRLKDPIQGRGLADSIKGQMQSWESVNA